MLPRTLTSFIFSALALEVALGWERRKEQGFCTHARCAPRSACVFELDWWKWHCLENGCTRDKLAVPRTAPSLLQDEICLKDSVHTCLETMHCQDSSNHDTKLQHPVFFPCRSTLGRHSVTLTYLVPRPLLAVDLSQRAGGAFK